MNLYSGDIPKGKRFTDTTSLVDSGMYAIVRHPQYVSWMFLIFGLILISQHWLSGILGIVAIVLVYADTSREDKPLLLKFGDDYKNYMGRVPRANMLLGIYRLLHARP